MIPAVFLFFLGLLLLYFGAEYLVSGSSRLALSFGIRPLIIGMTVVAFATSMPEMLVSLFAAVQGSSDLAAGNIIGSNIANIGLILGAAALLAPLAVRSRILQREIPLMLAASLLFWFLAWDGALTRTDGLLFLAGLAVFFYYCLRSARGLERPASAKAVAAEKGRRGQDVLLILAGIAGLGVGAELMVRSAIYIARTLGISELVIGLSVVALGTSLPELAASMLSAWKGEGEISIGNVLGSNIFNILFVLGLCPLFRPIAVAPETVRFEIPVMLAFSVALLPLVKRRLRLGRGEGGLLLSGYLVFIWALYR